MVSGADHSGPLALATRGRCPEAHTSGQDSNTDSRTMKHASPSIPVHPAWASSLTVRMRRHFALKVVGTTLVIAVFFVGYLHLLQHPAYPVTVMPLTALDRLVPFLPQALFVYLSLWLYVGMGPGLQLTLLELIAYAAWAALLCVGGLVIFYFWPTQVPPHDLDVSAHVGFAMLQGVDAAGNACPSMHVAFAVFSSIRIGDVLTRIGAPKSMRVGQRRLVRRDRAFDNGHPAACRARRLRRTGARNVLRCDVIALAPRQRTVPRTALGRFPRMKMITRRPDALPLIPSGLLSISTAGPGRNRSCSPRSSPDRSPDRPVRAESRPRRRCSPI